MEVSLNKDVLLRLQEVWSEIGLAEAERVRRTEALREQIIRVYVDALESTADERDALESELGSAEALLLELQSEVLAARSSAPPAWLPADVLGSRRAVAGSAVDRSWEPVPANLTAELSSTFGAGAIGRTAMPDTSVSCTLLPEQSLQREIEATGGEPPNKSTGREVEDDEGSGHTGDTSGRQGTLLQSLEQVSQQLAALEAQKRLFVERLGELQKRILTLWVDELGEVVDDLAEEYRDALVITGGCRNRNAQSYLSAGGNLSPSHPGNFTQITTIASDLGNPLRKISIRNYGSRIRSLEAKITELLELRQKRVETIASLLVSMKSLLRRLCITTPEEAESEVDRLAIMFDGSQEPLGASLVSIDVLTARVACLEREIEARVEELDRVSSAAAELYRLLRYPSERFSAFQAEHSTLSRKSLEAWHEHLEALRATREQRLRALIANEKERLNALWNELGIAPAQRVSFAFCSNEEVSEEVLQAIERETSRLEAIARKIRPIHELLGRREELLIKKQELEREMQNPERLFGRSGGRRIVGGLLREEQLRKQVRQLPKVNALLRAKLESYEQEFHKRFIYRGVDMLDALYKEETAEADRQASRPTRREIQPGPDSGHGAPWAATSPVRSGVKSVGTARHEATGRVNGTRPTTNRPTPSTWGGTAATKVLAAEVRKHVQCKREAETPLTMAGQAKTTSAIVPEKCSEKAAWGAWMPAAATDAPTRPTTIADLRGLQFFPASTDALVHQTNADEQARRMLVENTSQSSGSHSCHTELSASDHSTTDQSGRSMRAADNSPQGFAPDAGQASRMGTSLVCRVPTSEAPSESMTPKSHALAQTALQTDAQPIAAHDGFLPRVLSDASAASKLSSSTSSASDAGTATGPLSDDGGRRYLRQETTANNTLAPLESVAPAEQGTVSGADAAPPGSASLAATGVRSVRELERGGQSSAPALDQENSSLPANTTTPPLVVTPSTKESASAAAVAPQATESTTLFPRVAEPGVEVPNKRARADSCAAPPSAKYTTQTTSAAATSTTASRASSNDDSCETPKLGRTNGEQPESAAFETSMPLAHREAAPAQAQPEFFCAESPIR